eukprot:224760_1
MANEYEDNWSNIATISYFSTYILFIIALTVYVYITQRRQLDKSFLKLVWQQRKILGQIIIHFYDTATDIGVLLSWYYLYQDELNGTNYESVDMGTFFWASCFVLIFYRLLSLVIVYWDNERNKRLENYAGISWTIACCGLIIMTLIDMFILVGVYDSFKSAEDIMKENKRREERRQERFEQRVNAKLEVKQGKARTDMLSKKKTDRMAAMLMKKEEQLKTPFPNYDTKPKSILFTTNASKNDNNISSTSTQFEGNMHDEMKYSSYIDMGTIHTKLSKRLQEERDDLKRNVEELQQKLDIVEKERDDLQEQLWLERQKNNNKELIQLNIEEKREIDEMKLTEEEEQKIANVKLDHKVIKELQEKVDLEDIDPAFVQFVCMLTEAIIESMPQVVFQSVFIIRSTNDEKLKTNSNLILVFMSLI